MKRRTVPEIEMIDYGQEHLRGRGFVAMPMMESMRKDPQRGYPHLHGFYQVTLLTGQGRPMHDFRETAFSGPILFFVSPGQVHTASPDPQEEGWVVSFSREFFTAQGGDAGLLAELPFYYASSLPPWLPLLPEEETVARGIFQDLQREYDAAQPGAAEILQALLRILFVRASRWYGRAHPIGRGTRASRLVREFHLLVEQHFHEWQTLDSYAQQLGVTVNHLNDVVREETGSAAGEQIRQRRLLDAKRLLLHSDLSISEIGYRLGFDDPSYFSRFFRRYEGGTPAGFREEIREKYHSREIDPGRARCSGSAAGAPCVPHARVLRTT
ncbi:MAG: helix-turn-helix domain-containing protein [Luteolibacter sp.]